VTHILFHWSGGCHFAQEAFAKFEAIIFVPPPQFSAPLKATVVERKQKNAFGKILH